MKKSWSSEELPFDQKRKREEEELMPCKEMFLQQASKYKEDAEQDLEKIKHVIPHWRNYRQQHKEELDQVNTALPGVQDCRRKELLEELNELGGSASVLSCKSKEDCTICLTRPKNIVFQCGHQCCSTCSSSIRVCHMCRVVVVQRIKVYD